MSSNKSIIEYRKGSILIVQYNNPKRKNAFNLIMYDRVSEILRSAAEDSSISAVVLTGTGDFYSSGNDLANVNANMMDLMNALRKFIRAFILFPKTLIAIVNGPAIGIAATTLALCDLVFASVNSYFYTPFVKLGVVPEGCSSLTFPRIMGDRKALEMLLFNHKMYAEEALACGFVNFIYSPEEVQEKVWNAIIKVSELSSETVSNAKKLLRNNIQEQLLETNDIELEEIIRIRSGGRVTVKFDSIKSRL
ncbi:enoyl-CoA delta isomerase 3, peroxisomal [Amyelois transitella]|uniref:enoyl-CoA delta isomerase 3, peroxisomal n=1 Tax=Amyelois transitella TaxID=680683 RepID=UPI00298F799F|nr:enoyl-CoA delta isomerase 3, peroxisomal [Amyelois transitella]XP_013190712.2 enoyl-CoA delta isomerase 3, peroxisomal [Amyelois transitella]XP_013190713.2 enoyl-CoA delta isomerase 3, peroxisomal [Amyelois transitella]XP_060802708.1 enoyl-CoA delta isomerase 3, peroxisomal [Amyelois transitella]XP_060802709.1 enoyl-CoA delta isomerase 3, peroxisomal [Amyelois transitella]XP_060802710.1 enoyl-CoA delta isomerase 3, peroxisomal [Amyelois transitella]XP_060802711.1 enoyl-CoA delta isomerase 